MRLRLPIFLLVMIVIQGTKMCAQRSETTAHTPTLDSVMKEFRWHPPKYFKEILMERKSARQRLQRSSYAHVLNDVVRHDGIGALFSYLRMSIQLEFSLDHGFLFWIVPPNPELGVPGIAFQEDLSFPSDPWQSQ